MSDSTTTAPAADTSMADASASGAPVLTNKQKRLLKKEEKFNAKRDARKSKSTGEQPAAPLAAATEAVGKRKREDAAATLDSSGKARADADAEEQEEEEVEAISHKEQRKRRKLEKQQQREGGASSTKPSTSASNSTGGSAAAMSAAAPRRSQYSVWVGNLSFRTSSERLQQFIESRADLEALGVDPGTAATSANAAVLGMRQWGKDAGADGSGSGSEGPSALGPGCVSRIHMPRGAKKGEHNKG